MTTEDILVYGLLLIPFLGTILAGYGKVRVGPFFGIILALSAVATLLSYILLDLSAALLQLGALALGALLFFLSLGLLGERFSYRSPMLLLASVALFPLGLVLSSGYLLPLMVYGVILVANILFAFLIAHLRKNTLTRRYAKKNPEKVPKSRYILTSPAIIATVVAGLTVLISYSAGTLL